MTTKKNSQRKRCGIMFTDKTLTQQSHANETNINKIMARYKSTGIMTHEKNNKGSYGDFSNVVTYQEALHKIAEAEQMFMDLPATVRQQFANDPAYFLDYVQNPVNRKNLEDMGLIEKIEPDLYGKTPPSSTAPAQQSLKEEEAPPATKKQKDTQSSP